MKGDYEIVTTPLSVLIFISVVVSLGVFVGTYLINYQGVLHESSKNLHTVDIAHLVKECFEKGKSYIDSKFLTTVRGKSICELCDICGMNAGVKIEDLETQKTWEFEYTGSKKYSHKIFVDILEGNEIHLGRIYVEAE